MSELSPTENAFLEELAGIKKAWTRIAAESVKPEADLTWVDDPELWNRIAETLQTPEQQLDFENAVSELLFGVIHSFLVSLDGGTGLAVKTLLSLEDQHDSVFRRHLHEYWPEYGGNET